MDGFGEEEVVVFTDEDVNEYEYIVIGQFPFEGKEYTALTENTDVDEDEEVDLAFAELKESVDGEDEFVIVDDEALDQRLFDFFRDLLEQEEGCGCGEDDCDCGAGCDCHKNVEKEARKTPPKDAKKGGKGGKNPEKK